MNKTPLSAKDFENDREIKWCPGCGDYAILKALQKALPLTGIAPEKHVVVSGIGCAGRLPYYLNTYGLHTIHGRAPTVAMGLKAMRDDLTVWVITGDGDALSIGGNHFIHCLRRNLDINILLINNQVYGLTKGQFSPTSSQGQITKTSPDGLNQVPLNPISLALSAGATFVARGLDKDPKHLADILVQAHKHKGSSFVEIYQDCHIFNAGAFDAFSQKLNRADNTLQLQAGHPIVYGQNNDGCLVYSKEGYQKAPHKANTAIVHQTDDWMHAQALSRLSFPDFPVPIGVIYQKPIEVFAFSNSVKKKESDLETLFRAKAVWKQT